MSSSGEDNLLNDSLSVAWILLKVVAQSCRHSFIYGSCNLVVTQLSLSLTLKLRLCNLYRDNSGKTLAEVIT